MPRIIQHLNQYRAYAPFLLRLVCAYKLYDAAGHTAMFPAEGIPGYADWLKSLGFPFPMASAILSAYTEFIGAILILIGWQTRWAALFLAINFLLAVLVGHLAIGDSYANTFPALAILGLSIFLIINGPGKPSIDEGL